MKKKDNTNKNLLTPLELKVMDILWELEQGYVKDVLEQWTEEPKPAYNTVSTIVRILQKKKVVGHHAHGRTHQYYPLLTKEEYQQQFLEDAVDKVFAGSVTSMVSMLMDGKKVSEEELNELKKMLGDLDA